MASNLTESLLKWTRVVKPDAIRATTPNDSPNSRLTRELNILWNQSAVTPNVNMLEKLQLFLNKVIAAKYSVEIETNSPWWVKSDLIFRVTHPNGEEVFVPFEIDVQQESVRLVVVPGLLSLIEDFLKSTPLDL